MFLLFIVFCIHAKFSNRQTDNIIVELHIKIRKKDIILVGKAKQKTFFAHILMSHINYFWHLS